MSYDLYFTSPEISLDEFDRYFGSDARYEIGNGQAFYTNEITGVYFSFDHNSEKPDDEDGIEHSVVFNMNYYRPHYFALEAEPEVSRFIKHFNCTIHDYQYSGMEDGHYSREGFLRGWNHGNEFGYSAILGRDDAQGVVYSKPAAELENIWMWNATKEKKEKELKEDIFIPRILFMTFNGRLGSACIWPDGISTLIPQVDFLYVPRKELAPKKWVKKQVEDFCIVPQESFPEFFAYYTIDDFEMKSFKLPAPDTPEIVKDYVRKLTAFEGTVERIGFDSVLNSELVGKYKKGQQSSAYNSEGSPPSA